ncbi:hypothetical protein BO83DRAFT_120735 [Aspergillus eucalypticola CBS 122712]|uniref:Uncharacterized protein n=1 Tax=Aspergillus eucalypticola (strain CBS 122712 / IBT 29274) TaxID=1448314 RepID=A0A317UV69_ASPEC|nr:uncharacterized protein BO83DRAFT_120735 [Aspergillus eucalypticola CBS 122712]PWY65515.1 hypothetical protein BO83DRAFT_120735 [Aspergillus eucalypticola CBS 122712]
MPFYRVVPPGRLKGKFSPFANHFTFSLYPVRHWFGPHPLPTTQRLWGGAMAWWWWQLANHGGPRREMVEVSRLSVESGQGEGIIGRNGCVGWSRLQHHGCSRLFYLPGHCCYYTWIPCFVHRALVYVHQMAHGSLLGLDFLTGGPSISIIDTR